MGGCGGNAVDHMIKNGVEGVEFICRQHRCPGAQAQQARNQLQLGSSGLGAGAKPEIGRAAR